MNTGTKNIAMNSKNYRVWFRDNQNKLVEIDMVSDLQTTEEVSRFVEKSFVTEVEHVTTLNANL